MSSRLDPHRAEVLRQLQHRVDGLQKLEGQRRLRAGVEILVVLLELAEGLTGLCYELRAVLGLESWPELPTSGNIGHPPYLLPAQQQNRVPAIACARPE